MVMRLRYVQDARGLKARHIADDETRKEMRERKRENRIENARLPPQMRTNLAPFPSLSVDWTLTGQL